MFIYGKFLYKKPVKSLIAFNHRELLECFKEMDRILKSGKKDSKKKPYCVGYITYEAGIVLQAYANDYKPFFEIIQKEGLEDSNTPLLHFIVFKSRKNLKKLSGKKVKLEILKDLDEARFYKDFEKIKQHINQGDTYQVNYTQELTLQADFDYI